MANVLPRSTDIHGAWLSLAKSHSNCSEKNCGALSPSRNRNCGMGGAGLSVLLGGNSNFVLRRRNASQCVLDKRGVLLADADGGAVSSRKDGRFEFGGLVNGTASSIIACAILGRFSRNFAAPRRLPMSTPS
jgi:hypothetical protein